MNINVDIYMVLFLVSFVAVLVISYFYLKLKDKLLLVIEQYQLQEKQSNEQYTQMLDAKRDLELNIAVLNTRYEEEIKSSNEKLLVLQDAKDALSKEFKFLANQIFEDKSKQFSHTQKEQFEVLLKPFREQITNFSQQSKEQFNTTSKDGHLLKDELLRLKEMNQQLSQDALNLTNALKGENKTQGNWGEIVLQKILEDSGLREGSEYEIQATLKSDEGKMYRPDVIVHLPQDRDIVIDSKVSLVAYERFMSTEDETLKKLALKEHLKSISGHIKDLSSKNYEKLEGLNTLDYVLLFMPIEGAFCSLLVKMESFLNGRMTTTF
ncbi:MAG: DNA recombination protein RmuC [Sulfurimonas sp.]|nr:DNA recombination protein RmuC [Sulfurimonas sp.]